MIIDFRSTRLEFKVADDFNQHWKDKGVGVNAKFVAQSSYLGHFDDWHWLDWKLKLFIAKFLSSVKWLVFYQEI